MGLEAAGLFLVVCVHRIIYTFDYLMLFCVFDSRSFHGWDSWGWEGLQGDPSTDSWSCWAELSPGGWVPEMLQGALTELFPRGHHTGMGGLSHTCNLVGRSGWPLG